MLEFLKDGIVWIINFLIYMLGSLLDLILSFLPNSPFSNIDLFVAKSGISEFFSYLAWLVPIKQIVSIVGLWVACIGLYYIYSVALRWFKIVE